MDFRRFFSGKSPGVHEKRGDHFFERGNYGDAKLEYETGFYKLTRNNASDAEQIQRLDHKIAQSREALALTHKKRGEEIMESQYFHGAEEVFQLALELTEKQTLRAELQERLREIKAHYEEDAPAVSADLHAQRENPEGVGRSGAGDDYFAALCGAFPEKSREKAYMAYGKAFKDGYMALNRGDFELAASLLLQSMEENSPAKTYIPLELATAYLNLGKNGEAERLLTSFLQDFPDSAEAYQLICETFWAQGEPDNALGFLQDCPRTLVDSVLIRSLKGETLFRAGKFREAESLLLNHLRSSGWDENMALSLARTYEALNEKESALDLYEEIMERGSGCGGTMAPFVKQSYCDLSLECGRHSPKVLELYFSLVQEDPGKNPYYFKKISETYSAMGDEEEAERFRSLSERSAG